MGDLFKYRKEGVPPRVDFKRVLDDFSLLANDLHRRDWERHLRKILRRIGYERYLLSLGPSTTHDPFNRIMTTYPSDWLKRYKDENFIQVDPIIRHCRHHFAPLFWGARTPKGERLYQPILEGTGGVWPITRREYSPAVQRDGRITQCCSMRERYR